MFYAIGVNKDGKEFVVASNHNIKIFAENEIIESAMSNGLSINLNKVRQFQGTQKGGSTTTKEFLKRKKLRAQGKQVNYGY